VVHLAQEAAGANPKDWLDVLRHDVAPVASAFAVWVAVLVSYCRSTRRRRPLRAPPLGRKAFEGLASMAVGGYLVFLAIVVVFYFVLGGEKPSFIVQALREGSVLAFGMVVPAFLALSWLDQKGWLPLTRRRP
jgi:Family of unknown function (DUF6256)